MFFLLLFCCSAGETRLIVFPSDVRRRRGKRRKERERELSPDDDMGILKELLVNGDGSGDMDERANSKKQHQNNVWSLFFPLFTRDEKEEEGGERKKKEREGGLLLLPSSLLLTSSYPWKLLRRLAAVTVSFLLRFFSQMPFFSFLSSIDYVFWNPLCLSLSRRDTCTPFIPVLLFPSAAAVFLSSSLKRRFLSLFLSHYLFLLCRPYFIQGFSFWCCWCSKKRKRTTNPFFKRATGKSGLSTVPLASLSLP